MPLFYSIVLKSIKELDKFLGIFYIVFNVNVYVD
jgi:hypothetical protein